MEHHKYHRHKQEEGRHMRPENFARRFLFSLLLTVPVLVLSPFFQDIFNFNITFEGDDYTLLLPASSRYDNRFSPNKGGLPVYGGTATSWQKTEFDLSAYADQTISICFQFQSENFSMDHPGYYLDDLMISDRVISNIETNLYVFPTAFLF